MLVWLTMSVLSHATGECGDDELVAVLPEANTTAPTDTQLALVWSGTSCTEAVNANVTLLLDEAEVFSQEVVSGPGWSTLEPPDFEPSQNYTIRWSIGGDVPEEHTFTTGEGPTLVRPSPPSRPNMAVTAAMYRDTGWWLNAVGTLDNLAPNTRWLLREEAGDPVHRGVSGAPTLAVTPIPWQRSETEACFTAQAIDLSGQTSEPSVLLCTSPSREDGAACSSSSVLPSGWLALLPLALFRRVRRRR